MKKNLALILLFLISNVLKANIKDSLAISLENIIEKKDYYLGMKLQKITEIKLSIEDKKFDAGAFDKYNALYNEYKSFNYDSAFKYANILADISYKLGDKEKIALAKLNIGFILLSSGMFKETLDTIQTIQYNYLTDSAKCNYFALKARTYYDMADYAADEHYRKIYNILGDTCEDTALKYTSKDKPKYYSLMGLKSLRNANMSDARKYYEKLVYSFKLPERDFAIEASSLSFIYYYSNEPDKSDNLLAQAAMADIMLGTKETTAIRDLAEREFKNGNINRAYKYINLALDDAYFYGARHRKIQISNILPIIEEKHLQEVESRKKQLIIYLICISALVVLLIAFVIIILNLNKKLRTAKIELANSNEKLSRINNLLTEANHIKEEYIGHFFNVISEYISKIEKFKKAVERRLVTNNIAEIKETMDNIDPKKERENLYLSFDNIFLKIFPGFIDKFNNLLKEEERVTIKDNQPLLPEQRIYALMRLGIDDPEKIAKILNYSIHTIYTYKTKIRTKALVPNEQFELKVMEIQSMVNL
jgi:hypothetical protein